MAVTVIRSDTVLVRVIIGCMFFRVVIESKTYCIYEPVLQAIKSSHSQSNRGIKFYIIIQ
jgi:hypothetical protein